MEATWRGKRLANAAMLLVLATMLLTVASLLIGAAAARAAFPGHNGAIGWVGRIDDRPFTFTDLGLFRGDTGTGPLPMGKCEDNFDVGFNVCPIYKGLSFSPDGTRVAVEQLDYTPEAPAAASRLAVGSGGGTPTALPALTSGDADPAWSGDGRRLVFAGALSASGTGRGRIYTVASDGSHLRRLTSARDSREPRFSPDDRYIAFVRYSGRRADLWVMRANGSGTHRLAQDVGFEASPSQSSAPSWSPRGATIAFGHRGAIYTIGVDGRHLHRVTSSAYFVEASTPAWSPNGTRIAFVGLRRPAASNGPSIWTIDPAGGHPHELVGLENSGEDYTLNGLDWQPLPAP